MFASIYLDGASVAVFIARITAVDDALDTITVSLTAKSGTAPTDGATGRTIKVGGAWKGPNGAEIFPFGFVQSTMMNSSNDVLRVNFKNGVTYSYTASLAHANSGPTVFQGYTTSAGDLGKATFDGGTSAIVLVNLTGVALEIADIIAQNNGTTGTNSAFTLSAISTVARRCVANTVRGTGFNLGSATAIECEAYACNSSNTASSGGFFAFSNVCSFIRCISHDNVGSNNNGFYQSNATAYFSDCIADSNGLYGFFLNGRAQSVIMLNCDSYNNGGDGVRSDVATSAGGFHLIENTNLIKNGGYGINDVETSLGHLVRVINCGFGAGTQANTSGQTTGLEDFGSEEGSVTYANDVTPWVDPANGDFRINLAAAKNAGRGAFTQTAASYAGAIGYPDIGAVQHQDAVPLINSRRNQMIGR